MKSITLRIVIILFNLFIIISGCSMNNILWEIEEKGEVYSALFSMENKKVLITSEYGLRCYNLQTGKKEWTNKEINSLYEPSLLNDELITGSEDKNNIYRIDIRTGEYTKNYEIDEPVVLTALGDNNLLYFVSRKNRMNYLWGLNLSTNKKETLFEFDGDAKGPLIIHNENIIVSAYESMSTGKLYCVNKITGDLNWIKTIYDRGILTEETFVKVDNSIFYVDMQKDIKNNLVEIDIQTGKIIKKIKPDISEYFTYMDYVTSSHILSDGENVLVSGNSVFIYNTVSEKIKEVLEKNYMAILNNGNIIYHDGEIVYLFNIQGKNQKEIYKLKGKQVFCMFAEEKYILLILADNIKETMANNGDFSYVLLEIKD